MSGSLLIVHVHVSVKAGAEEAFCKASRANAEASRLEPGVARFDLIAAGGPRPLRAGGDLPRPPRPRRTRRRRTTPRGATPWRALMAEPRTSVKYANVYPGDEAW